MAGRAAAVLLGGAGLLAAWPAGAQGFSHGDWELACDNTHTCRAAGYQREADENAVSVLLTRKAGPGTPVEARAQLGTYGDEAAQKNPGQVALTIAGRPAGTVVFSGKTGEAVLASAQVEALLKALVGTGEIVFSAGKTRWRLSGEGATAVLLKMDDLQGRVGTPGAIARKGTASEARVVAPAAAPQVQAVRLQAARKDDAALALRIRKTLQVGADDCADFAADDEAPKVWRVDARRVLVSSLCFRAAYNEGYGYWIANDKPPYDPQMVTAVATDFDPATGELVAASKGRGLGDCRERESWVWDGREFVHVSATSTGMCRLVAPGGPWDLPTLVSVVNPPK
jgi:hypothetical protein